MGCGNETIVCFECILTFEFHNTLASTPLDVLASVITTSTDKFERKSRELHLPTNILSQVKLPVRGRRNKIEIEIVEKNQRI